jgi:AraC-like DNA-binding protein
LQNCRHELEMHGGKTITDVAFSWGFSSSSHFSRVFRKYFGIVPSSILKAQRSAGPGLRGSGAQRAAPDGG